MYWYRPLCRQGPIILMPARPLHDVASENGPPAKAEETSMTIYISQGRYTPGHEVDVCEAGGSFRGCHAVVRGGRWPTDQLVSQFGTVRLAGHSGSTGC